MNRRTSVIAILAVILASVLFASCANGFSRKTMGSPAEITVDAEARHQFVRGFGGMSNAWISPRITEEDIDVMYGENGLGFNIFRLIISHDPRRWSDLVDAAKRAKGYGAIILASPWTPPVEFKSNKSHIGGRLLPEHYGDYAAHLRSYVNFMADNGVKIDVISIQNEPDISVSYDSCDWTSRQMLDFIKTYGREIGDVKIIPGESYQFKREFTNPMLNDPAAVENFDIVGGHIYGAGLASYPLAVQKGKEVWMTEHLLNTPGGFPSDLTWRSAMLVAKEIHDCMSANFNVYLWWYLKRFYSMLGDDEYGSEYGEVLRRGYVMSHYAKYAAGKTRIDARVTGNRNVIATSYEGDNSISLVIINRDSGWSEITIQLAQNAAKADAVETTESASMQAKPVRLGNKSVTLTASAQSVVSVRIEL